MEAGDLPVPEEQHPNLTLWYCLLNCDLWICCNKLVEILLVWNETLHLKWLLMHNLASPVVFMHMVPASLIRSRNEQGKRDANGWTAGEGEKCSLLAAPYGGRQSQAENPDPADRLELYFSKQAENWEFNSGPCLGEYECRGQDKLSLCQLCR